MKHKKKSSVSGSPPRTRLYLPFLSTDYLHADIFAQSRRVIFVSYFSHMLRIFKKYFIVFILKKFIGYNLVYWTSYLTSPTTHQFSSITQSCPTLWDLMDWSTPGLPVHHQLPELTQTHVHLVGDAIQPSHPLSSPSPPTFDLSQHQGFFLGVSSSHQVAKVLEFLLQHQSFQWIFRTDFL